MDFKAYAKSASAFDGQMTFWILPFTTPLQDTRQSRLDDIDPQFEYMNDKTGKIEALMPDSYRKAMTKARDMNVPGWEYQQVYGGWRSRTRWGSQHTAFLIYDTHTVAIDFALADGAPTDLRIFEAYWTDCADADLRERWGAFQYAVSQRVITAWRKAFEDTRDNPAPAPVELGLPEPEESADPNASSGGEPSETTTSSS